MTYLHMQLKIIQNLLISPDHRLGTINLIKQVIKTTIHLSTTQAKVKGDFQIKAE